MSTIYLTLLGAYAGQKELKRWTSDSCHPELVSGSLDSESQEIMDYVSQNGRIDNKICQEILGISSIQSYRILDGLVKKNKLVREGMGRSVFYRLP